MNTFDEYTGLFPSLESPGVSRFEIPLVPPSVNHYKQPRKNGGWFITKEAQAFIDAVCMIGRTQVPNLPIVGQYYEVWIVVYLRTSRFHSVDSDNMQKVEFDALTKAGIVRDDRYITRHHHRRLIGITERTCYFIRGLEQP